MKVLAQKFQTQIANIYNQYREVVFPLVAFIETIDCEFPIEIVNEIRSIFSHFSRTYDDSLEENEIATELSKAEGHLKRAILDCYKYACLSLVDFYEKFRKEYKFSGPSGNRQRGLFAPAYAKFLYRQATPLQSETFLRGKTSTLKRYTASLNRRFVPFCSAINWYSQGSPLFIVFPRKQSGHAFGEGLGFSFPLRSHFWELR